ncbi:MAG: hypothetical protein EZS28_045497, partial [Streblomastix strix]
MLQIDVSNTRLIEGDKIEYSDTLIRIEHCGKKNGNDDNDAKLITVGHCVLEKRVSQLAKNGEVEFKNVEELMSKYPKNRIEQQPSNA